MLHTERAWDVPGDQITPIPHTLNAICYFLAGKRELQAKDYWHAIELILLIYCTHYPHMLCTSNAFT